MREKKSVSIERFDNFDSESSPYVESCYNFLPTGRLSSSHGVRVAKFPTSMTDPTEMELNIAGTKLDRIDGVSYFKQYFADTKSTTHRLLVYGGDDKVYINQMFCGLDGLFHLYNLKFENPPITLAFKQNDLDAIILTDKQEMRIWTTGYSPYTITGVPVITSMCMNEGVLFCTLQEPAFKIWYATNLNAENVGNIDNYSGYISLEDDLGYARKILTFDENVYVFRDYGISKVNFSKNSATFSQIYQSNTMIFSDTVNVCGNKILFTTKDGLYSFNGISVSKLKIDIFDNVDFANSLLSSASLGDEYYIAVRMNFGDGEQVLCETGEYHNNALIILNVTNLTYEVIRGVDIGVMLPLKTEMFEKMILTFNSMHEKYLGEITNNDRCFNEALPKCWTSGQLVDNLNTKLFNKLTIHSTAGVKFTLIYDGKEISFTTYQDGLNEFYFQIVCREVKLKISTEQSNASVDKVVLDYYAY